MINFQINELESLASLDPQNVISLRHLYIVSCPKLQSLWLPITLANLEIMGYWPPIAYIPKFKIDEKLMYYIGLGA